MSWDIVLFNSSQKITSIEDLNEDHLIPIDFCSILEKHFVDIKKNENHREIAGNDYSIDYFIDDELVSNKMLSLYGENGLFVLIGLARKQNWQYLIQESEKCLTWKVLRKMGMRTFKPISNK